MQYLIGHFFHPTQISTWNCANGEKAVGINFFIWEVKAYRGATRGQFFEIRFLSLGNCMRLPTYNPLKESRAEVLYVLKTCVCVKHPIFIIFGVKCFWIKFIFSLVPRFIRRFYRSKRRTNHWATCTGITTRI